MERVLLSAGRELVACAGFGAEPHERAPSFIFTS